MAKPSAAAPRWALIAGAALVGLVGGPLAYAWLTAAPNPCGAGQVAGGAIGGPFTLVDQTGATVTDRDVITGPTLVYFGYTFCPDVCPLDNARNAEAVDILEEQGIEVTPVFITVDPARDTPAIMAEAAAGFHPRMIGLTGTPEQVDAAKAAYRAFGQAQPAQDGFYLVDHSTFTYLMTPAGFLDFFHREASADEVATRTACLIDAAGA